jgi:hypothetical protein
LRKAVQATPPAEALREAMGAPLPSAERAAYDQTVAAVRAALARDWFATAWADGHAMPLQDAAGP